MKPTWERDGIQLYLGDCLEVLPTFEAGSVDVVVTDPPYLNGDMSAVLDELGRIAERVVVTPGKKESFNWIRRRVPDYEYAWKCSGTKSRGGSACLHVLFEPILAYGFPLVPLGSDLLDYPLLIDPMANGHPWPKPLPLVKKLAVHWARDNQTILDPFMGSGTTGVACVQTGRRFIGIEIDPGYFAIAQRRIEQAMLQMRLPL